jgi:hypothetical protein
MIEGPWECFYCRRVYGPNALECAYCNSPEQMEIRYQNRVKAFEMSCELRRKFPLNFGHD